MDINDLTIVLAHYGQTGMTWTQGEFTGDGTVDINDLTIVLAHYGQSVGSSAAGLPPCRSLVALVVAGRRLGRPIGLRVEEGESKDRRMLGGGNFRLGDAGFAPLGNQCRRGEGSPFTSPARCFVAPASNVGTTG